MSEEPSGREPIGEDARIDALEERLKAAREREDERNRPQVRGVDANERLGHRVLAELLGGIGGGALIGLVIDQVVNYFTGKVQHWGLLVMMFLGIIVSFRNIIRISNRRPD